jgi:hypothetical protein
MFVLIIHGAKAPGGLWHQPWQTVPIIQLSSPAKAGDPVRCGIAIDLRRFGILDHPLEPVIGRRDAPTRWRVMTAGSTGRIAPMVIVLRNARVNRFPQISGNPHDAGASAIPRQSARPAHLQPVHRDT